jgi:hypothetical protein
MNDKLKLQLPYYTLVVETYAKLAVKRDNAIMASTAKPTDAALKTAADAAIAECKRMENVAIVDGGIEFGSPKKQYSVIGGVRSLLTLAQFVVAASKLGLVSNLVVTKPSEVAAPEYQLEDFND